MKDKNLSPPNEMYFPLKNVCIVQCKSACDRDEETWQTRRSCSHAATIVLTDGAGLAEMSVALRAKTAPRAPT